MLIPTIYAFAEANPNDHFTLLTQSSLTKLIIAPPVNLHVKAIDIRGKQKALWDLLDYTKQLRLEHYHAVIDLHKVLRSRLISYGLCLFSNRRQYSICKPRKERKAFLNSKDKLQSVTPMLEIHARAFRNAGLNVPKEIKPLQIEAKAVEGDDFFKLKQANDSIRRIGIAPFASTESKTYDEEQMQSVIRELAKEEGYYIYLFGSKGREEEKLKAWAKPYDNVACFANKLSLEEELRLIAGLDCMLSMDSANAHLAAMVGTKVLSIWCTTHPLGGFMSLGQSLEDCLTPDKNLYPPCSIFGKVKDKSIDIAAYRKAVPVHQISEHIKKTLA